MVRDIFLALNGIFCGANVVFAITTDLKSPLLTGAAIALTATAIITSLALGPLLRERD
jgi:hypothetical protein